MDWHKTFHSPEDRAGTVRSLTLLALAVLQPIAGRLTELTGVGKSIEERSDDTRGPITPAKGAFAIWGPLFVGNLWLAWKSFFGGRSASRSERRIAWLNSLAFAGNTGWSLQAQFGGLGWPSVAIIATSAAAATAGLIEAETAQPDSGFTRLAARTTGPLAGWLTVATFANLDATMTASHGRPSPKQAEKRAMLLIGAASGVAVACSLASKGNPGYAAAAGWGLRGIVLRNIRERRPRVAAIAGAGVAGVLLATLAARHVGRR